MENKSAPTSETWEIVPSASQLKPMFNELLEETKKDILSQAKDNTYHIYTDFESAAIEGDRVASTAGVSEPGITDKIENFVLTNIADKEVKGQHILAPSRIWQWNLLG